MSCGSSPGVYLRCSLNSTEKPWKGLACRPCRNPLTMNLARKSSREICRITSGFRYCSTVGMDYQLSRLATAWTQRLSDERAWGDLLYSTGQAIEREPFPRKARNPGGHLRAGLLRRA